MVFGKILSIDQRANEVTVVYEENKAVFTVITDEIINVFVPQSTAEHFSKAIEGDKAVETEYQVNKRDDKIVISTEKLTVEIADDFKVDFFDANGRALMEDYTGPRKSGKVISDSFKKMLEAEGHDTSKLGVNSYDIMTVKKLDADDCFYGLGDKTGFMNKRSYAYENWNSDNPQAHTDDFHALYKSIPFLMCLKKDVAYGVFFDNTFHSYINLGKESDKYFFYGADGGNLDYYFIGGETLVKVIENYTYLTGRTPLPQLWTLGYHQSRWGYESAEDIRNIAEKMRANKIPCDVIHFDIDYMDNFKVFTWDEKNYEPKGQLFEEIGKQGFKPVTIIDPGTKVEKGYFMYDEGIEKGYFAKDSKGDVYENVVWPGDSVFPDFGRPEVRDWWGDKEKILLDMGVRGVWNDMNEPASFNGELPADVVFHDEDRKIDHSEMHNIFGHFMDKATYTGLRKHSSKRPFVITRACYAGTQKYSTVWTGDNQSLWAHLQMTIPQLCNLGMSGFAFCGADIGGFGADCTPELLTRWIQAAVFSPLFRNHAAKGTDNQEPWQFDEQTLNIYRKYVQLRYKFLPYIYDLFYEGTKTGLPVMRPLVLHYQDDPETRNLNGEFLVGENLLVAPVLEQGARKKMVYLPEGTWYDYWTGEKLEGKQYILRDAPIDMCPIFIKEASIIPTYEPVEYIGEKEFDTLHLIVTPKASRYVHYQDNGEDYDYENGAYNLYEFTTDDAGKLTVDMINEGYTTYKDIIVD